MSYKLPFLRKEKIAKDTWRFYFARTNTYPGFYPGQYDDVTLIGRDRKQLSESFTISSSPLENDSIAITTRIKENPSEFKKLLLTLKKGDLVDFFGPIGGFFLRVEDTTPCVFLAGGIGITPFYSMILYAVEKNLQIPMILLVSFSSEEHFIFHKELSHITKENKHIKIVYTTQRITESFIMQHVPEISKPIFMIAGSPLMVEGTIELLKKLNIPEENIKAEEFTGY